MRNISNKAIKIAIISTFLMMAPSFADDRNNELNHEEASSKLTLGLGVAFTHIDDYIGADESKVYILPVPYIYYQSEKFTVDRNAFEGDIFTNSRWHLALDAAGSIPVDSDKNKARKGMQDLNWIGELGPSIEYYLSGQSRSAKNVYIDFSVHKAIATNFSNVADVGWTSKLSLHKSYPLKSLFLGGETKIDSALSALAYSDKYSQYFYSISADEQTDVRKSYRAKGGYAGLRFSLGGTWRKNNIWVGVFTQYTNLKNTAFEDSPLVKSKSNLLAGIVVSYIFTDN